MLRYKLEQRIKEAIASKQTTDSNRQLLEEVLKDYNKATTVKDVLSIMLRLIEIIGAVFAS